MSTSVRVIVQPAPEVAALSQTCKGLATESALDRFEFAVKGRLQAGIRNDNDLRIADDLLHQVVLGSDALEAGVKPAISAAYSLHKSLLAAVKPWKDRWAAMRDSLTISIVNYNRAKEDLARRQQQELDRAAEQERLRRETEARLALRNGDMAAAQAVMEQSQAMVTPVVMAATPVLDHSQGRKPWQVEITDPDAVVRAIAAGIIPLSAIKEFDLGFLKREATKRGGLPGAWAGMHAWQADTLAVRR